METIRFLPCGESAVTVNFSSEINEDCNRKLRYFVREIEAQKVKGVRECVPAFCSATVYFDPFLTNHKKLQKALTKNGAIRLQYSVYEVNNTERILKNLMIIVEEQFAKKFSGSDSVIIFDVNGIKLKKYGNAIHRDTDIVYL